MRRVLIIEDDEEQAALAMRMLRREGIVCVLANRLDEGLDRDRAVDFDCVILDAGLPEISTPFDTIAFIRDFRAPVVVWTGETDPTLVRAVRETGAAFVKKPGGDLLIEKVWSQMNYRRAAADSEEGQSAAQQRIQDGQPIKETTNVTLTLTRVVAITLTLITAAAGITYGVVSKVSAVDANVTRLGEQLTRIATAQEQERARMESMRKWQQRVTSDIRRLGEKTQIVPDTVLE